MREEAEGANDLGGAIARQRLQHRLEITPRRIVLVAMEADGGPANPLHDVEDRFTLLLAHGIAENAAEQADIIPQRQVFLGFERVAARHTLCPVMITAVRTRGRRGRILSLFRRGGAVCWRGARASPRHLITNGTNAFTR